MSIEHDAQLVALDSLKPYRGNPRRGNVAVIRESLRFNGQYRPVVVRLKTREVLAGNHTLEAARQEGWSELWATFIDCDAKTARRIVLVDNRSNDVAGYDDTELTSLLAELNWHLDGTGYDQAAVEALLAEANVEANAGRDTDPGEVPAEPRTKPGDLYLLGEHRLLCGDSTLDTDVSRLMGGEVAQMVFTDPPYGVDYDGGTVVRAKLKGDTGTELYGPCCAMAFAFSVKDAPLYLWHAGVKGIAAAAAAAAAAAGWEIRCELVWNKNQAQFGALSAQYKQKHEPAYYCVKRGKSARWVGPTNEVTVWDINRAHVNALHPTQKPIDLAERALRNHDAASVLDLFAGSGSTLIACENLSRRCYAMEIDAGYVDVCVDRWERHTGRKATREPAADREPPSGKGRRA